MLRTRWRRRPPLALALGAIGLTMAGLTACGDPSAVGDPTNPYAQHPPVVDDLELGRSASFPAGISIVVDDADPVAKWWIGGIGRLADAALFAGPEYPWLKLTVVFSCARPNLWGKGNYANPRSVWYNSFFGHYRIDVPKQAWGRPFGYEPGGTQIRFEDLLRLGKADWNYFSNRVYGVPQRFVEENDALDPTAETEQASPQQIGSRRWDPFELRGVRVVSPYWSDRHAPLEQFQSGVTQLWQRVFGTHYPDPEFARSFMTTPMRARAYMCFLETFDPSAGGTVYSTYVFGGAVRQDFESSLADRLLAKQLEALEKVMAAFPPGLCLLGNEGCCRPATP